LGLKNRNKLARQLEKPAAVGVHGGEMIITRSPRPPKVLDLPCASPRIPDRDNNLAAALYGCAERWLVRLSMTFPRQLTMKFAICRSSACSWRCLDGHSVGFLASAQRRFAFDFRETLIRPALQRWWRGGPIRRAVTTRQNNSQQTGVFVGRMMNMSVCTPPWCRRAAFGRHSRYEARPLPCTPISESGP